MMISVDEAYKTVLEHVRTQPPMTVDINRAAGLCLAEDVASDIDMPPFDKSAMDGYAVVAKDATVGAELNVIENLAAGYVPMKTVKKRQSSKIMTGASIPPGADAVVKVEDTQELEGGCVMIMKRAKKWLNICKRAEDFEAGKVVLKKGTALRPQEIGILAMVGAQDVDVFSSPTVAIMSTGDELVKINKTPRPGQIRDSNSFSLAAQARQTGAQVKLLGSATDRKGKILSLVKKGLKNDILLISGGVSVGERDIVVDTLREAGVEIFFHKVAIRPGKPIVFGRREDTLVFGLPGNPVATFVNFELFVRPSIRRMMGFQDIGRTILKARMEKGLYRKRTRREYRPALLRMVDGRFYVTPVKWHGSADLLGATRGNSLLILPERTESISPGDEVDVMVTGEI
ncbi:MAG: gephyrin-like molybdotransferase Glp [Candidatus Brocadiales bacterium]